MFVNEKQIKQQARVITRFLAEKGIDLPHGQALDLVARLQAKADWNSLAPAFTEAGVNAELSSGELLHAEIAGIPDYGAETRIQTQSGRYLCTPAYPEECAYVRVTDRLGRELAYWTYVEWEEMPTEVMGGIVGALLGLRLS